MLLVCDTCGHVFDWRDPRSYTPHDERFGGPCCPACQVEKSIGCEAWAIWNPCQGVFACSVYQSRAEAITALIANGWVDETEKVVPVRVFRERDDRDFYRHASEYEREDLEGDGLSPESRRLNLVVVSGGKSGS